MAIMQPEELDSFALLVLQHIVAPGQVQVGNADRTVSVAPSQGHLEA